MTIEEPGSNVVYLDQSNKAVVAAEPADWRLFVSEPVLTGIFGVVLGVGIGSLPYL